MFFVTIPHSGRQIPEEAQWLKHLPPSVLFCDVDAFVDELYNPALTDLKITSVIFPWHRYAVDANRNPEDICIQTVEGAKAECRKLDIIGIHWQRTTKEDVLMPKPIPKKIHEILVQKYHAPFHQKIQDQFSKLKTSNTSSVYHLDLHSMPALGKKIHQDSGEKRAEIVIGNRKGTSASQEFTNIVFKAYKDAGFEVKLNWPYQGGRITERYGRPEKNQHTIQIELNRGLYMDENSGQKKQNFSLMQEKFKDVLSFIQTNLKNI